MNSSEIALLILLTIIFATIILSGIIPKIFHKIEDWLSWTWLITILALVGVVLNIYQMKECFYIWTFTNFLWMVVDLKKGIPSQAFLYFIQFLLAIWGAFKW